LNDSIHRFQSCIAKAKEEDGNSEIVDVGFMADIHFNMAQALKSILEVCVEENVGGACVSLEAGFQKAQECLECALNYQVEALRLKATSTTTDDHHDSMDVESEMEHDGHVHSDTPDDPESDNQEAHQVYDVTPETVIDTLVAHAALLIFTASTLHGMGHHSESLPLFQEAARKLDASVPYYQSPSTPEQEPLQISLARGSLLSAQADASVESKSQSWCAAYETLVHFYQNLSSRFTDSAEVFSDMGDAYSSYADATLTMHVGCSGIPGLSVLFSALSQSPPSTSSSSSSSSSSHNTASTQSPTSILESLHTLQSKATTAYQSALSLEPQNPTLLTRQADHYSLRAASTPTPTAAPTPALSLSNAADAHLSESARLYKDALRVLGVRFESIGLSRTFSPSPLDEGLARRAMMGLARVLSWSPSGGGGDEEVRRVLVGWKVRGGDVASDFVEGGVEFHERVLGTEWFSKIVC
jgi:hypothetical protein